MSSNHNHESGAVKNILFAFIFNLVSAIIQIFGGLFLNSNAIQSNGLHNLGDSLSLLFSLIMEKVSNKKRDSNFSYGYKRFSLLAALVNSTILIIGSVLILANAIPKIINPISSNSKGMLIFSAIGLSINLISLYVLKNGKSLNEKIVSWHLMDDLLGWSSVLIISIIMIFIDLPILDPILSILMSLYLLWNVFKLLKESSMIFLQATPANIDIKDLESELLTVFGVKGVHDLHIWTLDGQNMICTAHIVVNPKFSEKDYLIVKNNIKKKLTAKKISHTTIEIENEDENNCIGICN